MADESEQHGRCYLPLRLDVVERGVGSAGSHQRTGEEYVLHQHLQRRYSYRNM